MAKLTLKGKLLSPGSTVGTVCFPRHAAAEHVGDRRISDRPPGEELARFQDHIEAVCESIQSDIDHLDENARRSEADILRAHASILQDPDFHERVHEAIREMQYVAEDAVEHVLQQMAEMFAESEDSLFQERSADFRDLALRLREYMAKEAGNLGHLFETHTDPVPVLEELLPSIFLRGRRTGTKGFIVQSGTDYSHAVILAKSFGMPVMRVQSLKPLEPFEGTSVLLDGLHQEILLDPSEEELRRIVGDGAPHPKRYDASQFPLKLWLNITDPEQLDLVDWDGVAGVGLYRTEALFMTKPHAFPTEEEQREVYGEIFGRCTGRPITARTLDIGGDKPVEHMSMGPEENPQMGLRAHRLYHYHPDILITQVRALLRAAGPDTHLRLLYPLIESLDQWMFVQELTDRAIDSLQKEGVEFCRDFERGPLIETPAAVWDRHELIANSDFISVGTNDLVQYLFAVDRNNVNVGFLYRSEHPIVFRVLRELWDAAREAGKTMTVCGEMAGDLRLLPVLVGMGLHDLSVNVAGVGRVEEVLSDLDPNSCRELAGECLAARTGEEVRNLLCRWYGDRPEESERVGGVIDPVCKMTVDTDETPFTIEWEGATYYFCSRRCRDLFLERRSS